MNTKKMLPLFVLVPVVVVLGVALGVLNHADTEEEDTSIALCSLDADSVIAIAYKDASDGATLESALTKTDDTWTLDSDPALPLDQSKAQGVADSMTALTALRELSDDADVASMGFDTPTYELSLKTADTEWTLTVGSKNSITNNWYASLSADGGVYAGQFGPERHLQNRKAAVCRPEHYGHRCGRCDQDGGADRQRRNPELCPE